MALLQHVRDPLGCDRRRFDHLALVLSLEFGEPVARYPLWLCLHDLGLDPEHLDVEQALAFCRGPARGYLAERGHVLSGRAQRRICRQVARFDPERPSPEERLGALGDDPEEF